MSSNAAPPAGRTSLRVPAVATFTTAGTSSGIDRFRDDDRHGAVVPRNDPVGRRAGKPVSAGNAAQLSLALTLTRIEGGLMGPIEGYLTDKLGARKMVFMGFIILGLGFLASSGRSTPASGRWRRCTCSTVAYMVMAAWGRAWAAGCPMMTTINNWFSQTHGHGHGLGQLHEPRRRAARHPPHRTSASTAASSCLSPDTRLKSGASRLGERGPHWQSSFVIAAFPLSYVIRNQPRGYGPPGGWAPKRATPANARRPDAAPSALPRA